MPKYGHLILAAVVLFGRQDMNGKERVTATIARKPVDYVPLGFYAVDCDTVEKVLGRPTLVRDRIGQQLAIWEGRRDELVEGLKTDSVEFLRKIDCADLILAKEAPYVPPADYEPLHPKQIDETHWEDKWGNIYQAVPEVNELSCIHHANKLTIDDYSLENMQGADQVYPPEESSFEVFDHLCSELGDDRYIAPWMPVMGIYGMWNNFETSCVMQLLKPEVVQAAHEQLVVQSNAVDALFARPGCSGAYLDCDMAGTNGPFIGPDTFRENFFPYWKRRCENIKKHLPQIILHNCGMNIPLMDQIIEAGVDCYQSLQTTAGMEVGKLKEMFGDKLTFWGGVSVELLIDGTPEDVRKDVRNSMERGAPGGGFILGPSHSVAKGTKYDNFMAMLDEYTALRDKF